MNQEEFERLPAGGVGVEEALARLKRENPDAYAAHVSIMHRRPRGGLAVQEYSPVRGTLAWWECFQACLRSARNVTVNRERVTQVGAPRPSRWGCTRAPQALLRRPPICASIKLLRAEISKFFAQDTANSGTPTDLVAPVWRYRFQG
jgi:hypothetical protein